jgi:hypothetical protein
MDGAEAERKGDDVQKRNSGFGGALRADIPNFTHVTPVRQVSEILTTV